MKEVFTDKGIPVVPSLGEMIATHDCSRPTNSMIAVPPGNNDVWRKLLIIIFLLYLMITL
jgi:hypothetical protein